LRQRRLDAAKAHGENAKKEISNLGRGHDVDLTLAATKFPESVQISKMFLWKSDSDTRNGCLARTRTYKNLSEHQALTSADSQIDTLKLRSSALLIEFIWAWPRLGITLQRALVDIAKSYLKGIHNDGGNES
jgi:hypothetical protein